MFNAKSLKIVGACLEGDYLCRTCAELACAEDTDIAQDEITTSVLHYWLSQDHGERYTIRNLSESDFSPEGLTCNECCDIIFESACVVCDDELGDDSKHTYDIPQWESWSALTESSRWDGFVCSTCVEKVETETEYKGKWVKIRGDWHKKKDEESNDLCEGCPGIAVSFCLVATVNKQRFDCESFPRETK